MPSRRFLRRRINLNRPLFGTRLSLTTPPSPPLPNRPPAPPTRAGVAVGNSPWPIGVTAVGLHERASREKISFKYAAGRAHVMNDEATRKYIQALKRLMTFVQRRYPTDPSRSVDFGGALAVAAGAPRGDRLALLEAEARGDEVAPAPAPTRLVDARTGAVPIPQKWDQVIRGALEEVQRGAEGGGGA